MSKLKQAREAFKRMIENGSYPLSLIPHLETIDKSLFALERMQGVDLVELEKMIRFYTLPRPPSCNVLDYVEAENEMLNAAQTLADIKKEVE